MQPLSIHRVNTILYCRHWDEMVRFYRDVLKLPVRMEKSWFVEFHLNDQACLSIADAAKATIPSAAGAGLTLSLNVARLTAVRDRLIAEGVEATPIQSVWGSRRFFVFDPEGNRIEMWAT